MVRRFLRLFTAVVVFAFVLFAIFALSSVGVFGPDPERWATDVLRRAAELHSKEGEPLKYGLAVFGALTTILSGSWGIFKLWHFTGHRMPQRVEEFLEHNEKHLFEAGPMLLRAIEAPGPQKPWRAPIAFVGPLNVAMRKIGAGQTATAIPDLAESIRLLTVKRENWKNYEAQTRTQLINAHLLRGVSLAAEAGINTGDRAREIDIEAEHHFTQSIEIDDSQAEAYFYRGLQRLRLAWRDSGIKDLSTAIALTHSQPTSLVGARANYALGRLFHEESPNGNRARSHLKAAVDRMPVALAHSEEGAEILLLRAQIALGRNAPGKDVAEECLKRAETALSGRDNARTRACRERHAELRRCLDDLTRATDGSNLQETI